MRMRVWGASVSYLEGKQGQHPSMRRELQFHGGKNLHGYSLSALREGCSGTGIVGSRVSSYAEIATRCITV